MEAEVRGNRQDANSNNSPRVPDKAALEWHRILPSENRSEGTRSNEVEIERQT
jgi:hypothetical protein